MRRLAPMHARPLPEAAHPSACFVPPSYRPASSAHLAGSSLTRQITPCQGVSMLNERDRGVQVQVNSDCSYSGRTKSAHTQKFVFDNTCLHAPAHARSIAPALSLCRRFLLAGWIGTLPTCSRSSSQCFKALTQVDSKPIAFPVSLATQAFAHACACLVANDHITMRPLRPHALLPKPTHALSEQLRCHRFRKASTSPLRFYVQRGKTAIQTHECPSYRCSSSVFRWEDRQIRQVGHRPLLSWYLCS